jgi:flagellar motor component MotA
MNRDEFTAAYKEISVKAIRAAEIARREGLIALEEFSDETLIRNRDVFETGLRLVIDGIDRDFINRVLANIVEQEEDVLTKRIKTIQKEAVLAIKDECNPRLLGILLNSLTGFSYNDDPTIEHESREDELPDDELDESLGLDESLDDELEQFP